jgi:hypothetical protein
MEECLVIRRFCFGVGIVLSCFVILLATAIVSAAQSQGPASQKDAAQEQEKQKEKQKETTSDAKSPAGPADVSGDWQVSWEVRMGTNPGTLHLHQNGSKLTGTFKDLHGLSSVSGTLEDNRITFEVAFQGKYPFTVRFAGTASSDKLEGSSQAVNVKDEAGAYLGHGGEIVHPEHPWTATRVTGDPAHSSEPSLAAAPPAKK